MFTPEPPIEGWNKPVDRGPLMIVPYLPYVFGQVVYGQKGGMSYIYKEALTVAHPIDEDHFLLYMKIDKDDEAARPELKDVDEIWVAIRPRLVA